MNTHVQNQRLFKEIRDEIKAGNERQATFNQELKNLQVSQEQILKSLTHDSADHEKRIRFLERSFYIGMGILIMVRLIYEMSK